MNYRRKKLAAVMVRNGMWSGPRAVNSLKSSWALLLILIMLLAEDHFGFQKNKSLSIQVATSLSLTILVVCSCVLYIITANRILLSQKPYITRLQARLIRYDIFFLKKFFKFISAILLLGLSFSLGRAQVTKEIQLAIKSGKIKINEVRPAGKNHPRTPADAKRQ